MFYKFVVLFEDGFIDGYFYNKKMGFKSMREAKQRLENKKNPCVKILVFKRDFIG